MNHSRINNYQNIDPKKITSYGDHLGRLKGIQGRVSSCLHWDRAYDNRNLTDYYIQWVRDNPGKKFTKEIIPNQELRQILNRLNKLENFKELQPRQAAYLALAFQKTSNEDLTSIIDKYIQFINDPSINCSISAYIDAVNKNLKDGDIKQALRGPSFFREIEITSAENYIYDCTCSLSGYIYSLLPIIDTAFKALTFSMLWESAGVFLFGCFLADLSVTIFKGLAKGAWNYHEKGILFGAIQGFQEEWNKKIADDNSFHPFVEAIISSLIITVDWNVVDQLEKAAKIGLSLNKLAQFGIKNFVFKYAIMNCAFTLKAQLHQNAIYFSVLLKNLIGGSIRGVCKNLLMELIVSPWKLPLASSLLSYTPFLSEVYLKEWWINGIIAKTFIPFMPFGIFNNVPEQLISNLYLFREIIEINVNNITKTIEIITISILCKLLNKVYDYKEIFSVVIIALIAFYLKSDIKPSLGEQYFG